MTSFSSASLRWLVLAAVALAFGASVLVLVQRSTPAAETSRSGETPLVGFHIAAVPVNNPDRPPSDVQEPGGVLGYAIHLGSFQRELAKAGFEYLGTRGFPRTAACMLALASGEVEVASTGDSPAVLSRARGDKHRAIYLTPPASETWIVARQGGPRTLQELSGKKVGLLLGSTFDYYFRVALDRLAIDGVEFAQLQASAALPALQNGALDAYLTTAVTGALWQSKFGLPVIAKLSEVDEKLRGIGIVTAREDFLAENPGFATAYYRALRTGIDAVRADREAYFRWESEATGVPIEILRSTEPLIFGDTATPETSVVSLIEQLDFRVRTGVANAPFDVREWVVGSELAEGKHGGR